MFDVRGPAEGSIEAPLAVLADLQRQGLVGHIGLSNVTAAQVAEGRSIADIVRVRNAYNIVHDPRYVIGGAPARDPGRSRPDAAGRCDARA